MYKHKTLQVGQLPQEHLSLLQSLLNFIIIITKYLKQESNDDLCRCMDERSPSGLSTIGDMFYQCHMNKIWHYYPQWRSALSTFITELLLLPRFDNSSLSVT